LPRQLHNVEQFQKVLPKAIELRVVRGKESVKLKLRTPEYLYTYRTSEDEAEDLLKNAKEIEVIEVSAPPAKKEEKKEETD
jgi:hypothetical protein